MSLQPLAPIPSKHRSRPRARLPPPEEAVAAEAAAFPSPDPESEVPFGTSLFSVGILLLPACALGLRRFFRRRERAVPVRHPLC